LKFSRRSKRVFWGIRLYRASETYKRSISVGAAGPDDGSGDFVLAGRMSTRLQASNSRAIATYPTKTGQNGKDTGSRSGPAHAPLL